MKILMGGTRIVAIGVFFFALAGNVGMTQQKSPPPPGQIPGNMPQDPFGQTPTPTQNSKGKIDTGAPPFGPSEQKQAALRNEDRQKRLVADADRLLQLATQLHNEVEKTDQHILSIDVVKRADEIEKLAHNVKERMKG